MGEDQVVMPFNKDGGIASDGGQDGQVVLGLHDFEDGKVTFCDPCDFVRFASHETCLNPSSHLQTTINPHDNLDFA